MLDPLPSLRIAAAEGVAELKLAEIASELRESIERYQDEASSEAAYALGVVGNLNDLGQILGIAERMGSMTTRRRCLLGAAHLLQVESQVYRLFLKEGMERDTAVAELLGPSARRNPKVKVALEKYASDDEPGAIRALASVTRSPEVKALADHEVAESFLVAAAYSAAHLQ